VLEDQFDLSHIIAHIFSGSTIVVAFLGYFPAVAAIVALIWYGIQIYESHTVQRWLSTRRERKIATLRKDLARYEAQKFKEHEDPHRNGNVINN